MMKSKWQLGEEKTPDLSLKTKEQRKNSFFKSKKGTYEQHCWKKKRTVKNIYRTASKQTKRLSSHHPSYHLENNCYLGKRLQGASTSNLAIKYLVLTLKD